MANSMQHWNGNQLCVIDTETTGLDAYWHEMIQIAIVALDSDIKPRQDVLPFYIEIIPEHPERADKKAMEVNRKTFTEIAQRGHDREKAKDLLEEWIKTLGLPTTKYGNPKKIIPLGQNYAFDMGFIKQWLGVDLYNDLFDYHYVDTMITAHFLNDRAAAHAEKVPFSKTNLQWLARTLGVQRDRAHDALQDCLSTADVYRLMLLQGLLL